MSVLHTSSHRAHNLRLTFAMNKAKMWCPILSNPQVRLDVPSLHFPIFLQV